MNIKQARKAEWACEGLERLGFVWMPGANVETRPGIPSLMDYLRAQNIKPARVA